jgi:hypothetical protein
MEKTNGGRERMELKKLKKQDWSTSTYSGEEFFFLREW